MFTSYPFYLEDLDINPLVHTVSREGKSFKTVGFSAPIFLLPPPISMSLFDYVETKKTTLLALEAAFQARIAMQQACLATLPPED